MDPQLLPGPDGLRHGEAELDLRGAAHLRLPPGLHGVGVGALVVLVLQLLVADVHQARQIEAAPRPAVETLVLALAGEPRARHAHPARPRCQPGQGLPAVAAEEHVAQDDRGELSSHHGRADPRLVPARVLQEALRDVGLAQHGVGEVEPLRRRHHDRHVLGVGDRDKSDLDAGDGAGRQVAGPEDLHLDALHLRDDRPRHEGLGALDRQSRLVRVLAVAEAPRHGLGHRRPVVRAAPEINGHVHVLGRVGKAHAELDQRLPRHVHQLVDPEGDGLLGRVADRRPLELPVALRPGGELRSVALDLVIEASTRVVGEHEVAWDNDDNRISILNLVGELHGQFEHGQGGLAVADLPGLVRWVWIRILEIHHVVDDEALDLAFIKGQVALQETRQGPHCRGRPGVAGVEHVEDELVLQALRHGPRVAEPHADLAGVARLGQAHEPFLGPLVARVEHAQGRVRKLLQLHVALEGGPVREGEDLGRGGPQLALLRHCIVRPKQKPQRVHRADFAGQGLVPRCGDGRYPRLRERPKRHALDRFRRFALECGRHLDGPTVRLGRGQRVREEPEAHQVELARRELCARRHADIQPRVLAIAAASADCDAWRPSIEVVRKAVADAEDCGLVDHNAVRALLREGEPLWAAEGDGGVRLEIRRQLEGEDHVVLLRRPVVAPSGVVLQGGEGRDAGLQHLLVNAVSSCKGLCIELHELAADDAIREELPTDVGAARRVEVSEIAVRCLWVFRQDREALSASLQHARSDRQVDDWPSQPILVGTSQRRGLGRQGIIDAHDVTVVRKVEALRGEDGQVAPRGDGGHGLDVELDGSLLAEDGSRVIDVRVLQRSHVEHGDVRSRRSRLDSDVVVAHLDEYSVACGTRILVRNPNWGGEAVDLAFVENRRLEQQRGGARLGQDRAHRRRGVRHHARRERLRDPVQHAIARLPELELDRTVQVVDVPRVRVGQHDADHPGVARGHPLHQDRQHHGPAAHHAVRAHLEERGARLPFDRQLGCEIRAALVHAPTVVPIAIDKRNRVRRAIDHEPVRVRREYLPTFVSPKSGIVGVVHFHHEAIIATAH
mmetsp:Transcript_48895/g.148787  ORF Transcript_48895/g.148787 Transcript_48895/m.148787 type:complete len:1069 (+) Transcript_48895:1577-4783(+)